MMYTSWPDIYNQYVRNYEKMNEFFYGHGERWNAINELFVEAFKCVMMISLQVEMVVKERVF